ARIDEDRGLLHERQLPPPEEAARLRGEAQVERDEVGRAQQPVLGAGRPAPRAPRADVHAEGAAELGHARADLARAEDRERLAEELAEHLARPDAAPPFAVDPRDLARGGEHERQW